MLSVIYVRSRYASDPETCRALAGMRQWLGAHGCTPVRFDIMRASRGALQVNAVFKEDHLAEAFEPEFGR